MEDSILSIIIGIVAYPAFPISYLIYKKQPALTEKALKKIALINSIIIWVLFIVIRLILASNGVAQDPSIGLSAIVWYYINKAILKKWSVRPPEEIKTGEKQNTEEKKNLNT